MMSKRPQWRAPNQTARMLEEQKLLQMEKWQQTKGKELMKELLRAPTKKNGDSGL